MMVSQLVTHVSHAIRLPGIVHPQGPRRASSLWDPWGLFFIHLTHESEISDLKGMNSGWMNLG
jgi:hypothetical protein